MGRKRGHMIWIYRALFLPALLLASPYYLRRMWRRGGYGAGFGQRFGVVPSLPPKRPGVKRVWLQAVSVGEVLAIGPLIKALVARGDLEVYLTTTTSTGYRLAQERHAGQVVGIGYFPIDFWFFVRKAWLAVAPDALILTEGERWPEHLRAARGRGVPVVCVNARISDRGFRRMRRFGAAARSLFDGVDLWLPGTRQDAERLGALGFEAATIRELGNLKLDVAIPLLTEVERAALRKELGLGPGLVLLGSSTWPGEEKALLDAWRAVRTAGLPVQLLLVPRHAERRGEVEALLRAEGVTSHFRSRGPAAGMVEVAVGDTTGELRRLTQLADVVVIGKSLPPHHEGQTPVEAAALGKCLLFGPEMSNFRDIARELKAAGAARAVRDAGELCGAVQELLADQAERNRMAVEARRWQAANQGAVERTVAAIRGLIRLT